MKPLHTGDTKHACRIWLTLVTFCMGIADPFKRAFANGPVLGHFTFSMRPTWWKWQHTRIFTSIILTSLIVTAVFVMRAFQIRNYESDRDSYRINQYRRLGKNSRYILGLHCRYGSPAVPGGQTHNALWSWLLQWAPIPQGLPIAQGLRHRLFSHACRGGQS